MTQANSSFQLDAQVTAAVSYAMAHNRLPFVEGVLVANNGEGGAAVTLDLAVEDVYGVLTLPWSGSLELEPGERGVLPVSDLVLDPAQMLRVEEQRTGWLRCTLRDGQDVVAEVKKPLRILAAHHWLETDPVGPSHELLAAFVIPNDPAVQTLLQEASTLLQERTGSSSLEGYQSGSERVDLIAEAIFDAMVARRIRYNMPPASWGAGQKVRTPTEVLEGRAGTCLDTSVVYAAALEQAGLRPLVWLVHGHAFMSYWRDMRALESTASDDPAAVLNHVQNGDIVLVETTMITESDPPTAFATTHRPPQAAHLSGDLANVESIVDIRIARHSGILPLPSRVRDEEGVVQVVEYHPAEHAGPEYRYVAAQTSPRHTSGVPARVQQWKNSLLDLSLRNRLVNFPERGSVALAIPDGALGRFEDMVNSGAAVQLQPSDALDEIHLARGAMNAGDLQIEQLIDIMEARQAVFTDIPGASYISRLRSLAFKARTIVEETGANNLYLAVGTLIWSIDGKPLRSPLVLVPVTLSSKGRGGLYRMQLDESGTSTPNFCLLEKLRQGFGLEIPGLANPKEDDSGIDLPAGLRSVREAIAAAGLPFRVEESAEIAILQFAKFRLWKDLDEHWQEFLTNPLVRHLVETPTHAFTDPHAEAALPDLDALDGSCPIPADASQLEAIARATAGRTIVLEGPPGTGKSQTITNLLTRAIAEGKKVLFVAEKRAALDVVRSRLDAVGMGPFCLDLHDKGSKPSEIRAQLKTALDHHVQLDEQGYRVASDDLKASRSALGRYAQRLHESNTAGLSFYTARTKVLALGEGLTPLPIPERMVGSLTDQEIGTLRRSLEDLIDTADLTHPGRQHPWGFLDPIDPASVPIADVGATAQGLTSALSELPSGGSLATAAHAAQTPGDLAALATLAATAVPLAVIDEAASASWSTATSALSQQIAAFVATAHPGLDVATPAALDLPLAELHAQAQAAADSSFFGRKKKLLAILAQLQPRLRPGAEVSVKQLPALTAALLQVQTAIRGFAGQATAIGGLQIPASWNPLTPEGKSLVERQVDWLAWASRIAGTESGSDPQRDFAAAVRAYLAVPGSAGSPEAEAVRRIADAAAAVTSSTGVADELWREWSRGDGLVGRWMATEAARRSQDPERQSLRRWLDFLQALQPLRGAGLSKARIALLTGGCPAEDAAKAFDLGLAQVSLAERAAATGLDAFDTDKHERTVQRFGSSTRAVRSSLVEAIPQAVVARRAFQAGAEHGQVGALKRELNKQRRGLGIRRLLADYGPLISEIMPCILVSPDSVSRFYPVGSQTFDMVVFDEASQIRVADAIGAMGRARSVVVVGDSKQMPPTSFADTGLARDETEEVEESSLVLEDEESILTECVQAGVGSSQLTWHYRSVDESLIAFSNHKYYDGKLASFPGPVIPGHARKDAGVGFVRVHGTFQRSGKGRLLRTNDEEAKAVVAEIKRRFAASPNESPSVGVVTFNQQQRAHIEGLLRDDRDERLAASLERRDGEGLFVKNLENVQGDERDVILFSTGFSANDKGVVPLNFGPLNRGGGERRLNVAVTRARRQVLIFCSFDPADLRAENTSSTGVKHLKAYLELAQHGAETALVTMGGTATDRHRDDVADALRGRGLVVHTNVGLSDFKIDLVVAGASAPDMPSLAVLLDGREWAKRRTVGDRDGLPSVVLGTMLGWPNVARVWMPAWLGRREEILDRLVDLANGVRPAPADSAEPMEAGVAATANAERSSATDDVVEVEHVPWSEPEPAASALLDGAGAPALLPVVPMADGGKLAFEEPYTPWEVPWNGDRDVLDNLPARGAARQVRDALEAAVLAEGPVHLEVLAKMVAASFKLSRVSADRTAAILHQLPSELWPDQSQPFAWPPRLDPQVWQGFRRPLDGQARPIETIANREIGNAMVAVTRSGGGMTLDELLRETLAVFGGRRLTPGIAERLREALDATLTSGRLQERGGVLVVS